MIGPGKYCDVSELLGKTLTNITVEDEDDEIIFTCSDGSKYIMYHEQDCCELVYIDDISGELENLIGSPITMAEDISNELEDRGAVGDYVDSYTWTYYKLATAKGYVTIRWYGESNGYYSESVEFKRIEEKEN